MHQRIALKNLKHAAYASHETHYFNATIYLDGERAFKASNQGSGGPNEYFPYQRQGERDFHSYYRYVSDAAMDWMKETNPDFPYLDDGWTCLDFVITHLINERHLLETMRYVVKRKVVYLDTTDGLVKRISERPTPDKIDYLRRQQPTWKFFNDIGEDERLALWRRA